MTILPAIDLRKALVDLELFPNTVIIPDERYAFASENWVRHQFPGLLKQFQNDLRQQNWTAESNDCDDFAKMGVAFAKLIHHNQKGWSTGTGLAASEFYYTSEGEGPHVIMLFVCIPHQNGGLIEFKRVFIEPQTCQVIDLSRKEIESCDALLF